MSNPFEVTVDEFWLVSELSAIQSEISSLFNAIREAKDKDDRGEADETDRISTVAKFEMLNRAIGRGLMIAEILLKFGSASSSPEVNEKFEEIVKELRSISITSVSPSGDINDSQDIFNVKKKLEDLEKMTDKNKSESNTSNPKKSGNSILSKIRKNLNR